MMRGCSMILIGAACLAFSACETSDDPAQPGDLNVTGSWSGSLTVTTAADSFVGPAVLSITQTGTSVSGAMDFGDDAPLSVAGSLSGTVLTITITPAQATSDDCHLYPVTLVFSASEATLTVTSGSGMVCEGDGVGGHTALDAVTGASGTLSRT